LYFAGEKNKLIYLPLFLYGLLLPLIEYFFLEIKGLTGIILVVAASLLGLIPGIIAAAYASGVLVAIYFLQSGSIGPNILFYELFTYAILAFVIGLVVKYNKASRANLAASVADYKKLKFALEESQQRILNIFNFLPDPTFAISNDGRVIAWNKAIEDLTGIKADKIMGKDNYEYSFALLGERKPFLIDMVIEQALNPEIDIKQKYPQVELGEDNTIYGDTRCSRNRKKGGYLWTKASPLYSARGYLVGAIASLRDVTDRKQAEDKLKYLSFHDALTGLYNRAFFEEEIRRLNNNRLLPLSIIICDVNGLKLVNDTLGHQQGDMLLVAAARCIKSCCRQEDIVCRWGGDEFSVLLPNTDHETSRLICRRIKESCRQYDHSDGNLSLSLGAATRESPADNISAVIKKAEDRMYRHKITESKNSRRGIVPSLQKLLEEKTEETVAHASRLGRYALLIGQAVNLSPEDMNALTLLAALHDIGKIAIPDSIILKADKLSTNEWEIMKKHSEIGYNITKAIPELAHISQEILCHHEWWNGNGYPHGLNGEQIPQLSRIIALADAYDVMTSGRAYKKSLHPEKALQELIKYSGLHFEPVLVENFRRIIAGEEKNTHCGTGSSIRPTRAPA
jgi:diguanylate cyclase (GGDEF)-like protein/PAS domain S-box-containing protein